ncbi:Smr/MutS family protein [Marinilongibacter aquaticus]|uniref:Smr/MutS family protein n=1 Tax=Marinilongibacter aquaticus TaxID=2975157 RepID=UPI0021BDD929|nr:Smr/MutS family protein [Marinilongibacter aquaticus]UBM59451.1 Smr/MutS family protein [Marinilongibacter aquaticus]
MNFKIGDRVRMLRSSEEGFVVKVSGGLVEFETTDGFVLPVLPSDLVKVAQEEKEHFRAASSKAEEKKAFVASLKAKYEQAVTFAFEKIGHELLRPYLVNHFEQEILFVLSLRKDGKYLNFASGKCAKDEEFKFFENIKIADFDQWAKWHLQMLTFQANKELKPNFEMTFNLKASKLFKSEKVFGPKDRKGYAQKLEFHLDNSPSENLKSQELYFEPAQGERQKTIDLHAEALGIDAMKADEILDIQMQRFLKEFDYGLAHDWEELTVIHGVGNGVLRTKIHKHLANSEYVEGFKDAQKEKFGYGATLIRYKV